LKFVFDFGWTPEAHTQSEEINIFQDLAFRSLIWSSRSFILKELAKTTPAVSSDQDVLYGIERFSTWTLQWVCCNW